MRGLCHRFKGDYPNAILYAGLAEEYVDEHNLDKQYAYQAKRVKGLGLYHQGLNDQSSKELDEALSGFKKLHSSNPSDRLKHEIIMILADIGFIALGQGNIFKAQGSFREAFELSLSTRGNQGDLATSANNYAYLTFLMGDYPKAWQYYEQAYLAADLVGWDRVTVGILNSQAELLIQVDELEMADSALQKAIQILNGMPPGPRSGYTYRIMAELEGLKGNFNQAMFMLREAASTSSSDFNHPEYQVRLAEIYLMMEQPDLVLSTLVKTIPRLEENPDPSQIKSQAYYLMAAVEYQLGRSKEAQVTLAKALACAAHLGYDHFLVNLTYRYPGLVNGIIKTWKNKHLESMIERANNFQTGYQHLLTKNEALEAVPKLAFQVQAFGNSEIRRDAEVIPNAVWQSAGARALFFYILDRGKVKRDEIVIQFWPDFSNAKVNSNFHATLWRVRNALGSKHILAFDGEYYSINSKVSIFYDVLEFEEILENIKAKNLSDIEKRELSLQVVGLYRGDYLIDIDLPWFDIRRAELREKYRNHLVSCAERAMLRKAYEEARDYYEKAIALDPYQDHLHLALVKCLVQMKSPSAARAHYLNYLKLLHDDLGVEPMEEFKELFSKLQGSI
jgi:two-component SAPR family response regulator